MDDVLYTLSSARIKANELSDLSEVGKIELPVDKSYGGVVVY